MSQQTMSQETMPQENMSKEIHAHKILNQLREQPMSREALQQWVEHSFGTQVQFRTCKLNGFSLDELLAFFDQRSKVIEIDGQLHINEANVCRHH
ncbi:YecH family metal-binding protein [Vibrio sp. WXL210]|uniref:YecH family metal-binding protein n=1 Tax=Vibrio sp. WXL210 TaxID=3450709 RepID=UPI003EC6CFB9